MGIATCPCERSAATCHCERSAAIKARAYVATAVFLLAIGSTAMAKYSGGSGTAQDPYKIHTAADLIALGETPADYDKCFVLTSNIDLDPGLPGRNIFAKAVIAPDTDPTKDGFQGTSFAGVFEGDGHSISHLTVTGKDDLGLFGQLGSGAQVKNLGVVGVNITGSGNYVGGLVGENGTNGTVTHCYSASAVGGKSSVGGLVGSNAGAWVDTEEVFGSVTRCYSTGAVSGGGGGLVGSVSSGVLLSVWDTKTSGLSVSAGGVGLTTTEMMDPFMLGLNGFANDPNWVLDPGRDYPRLAWEGTRGQLIPAPKIDWLAGRGTAEEPYRIDTADQLIFLGRASALCDRHFVLGADIDMDPNLASGRVFPQAVIPTLTGVFDGNGHVISHLAIKGGSYPSGLFGQLAPRAEVRNLGVVDVNIAGLGDNVGGLVGWNSASGTLTQCYSIGAVEILSNVVDEILG